MQRLRVLPFSDESANESSEEDLSWRVVVDVVDAFFLQTMSIVIN